MKNIDLIILCGGKGTRIRSIIKDKPKILAEINGRPFIEYLLKNVVKYNFDNIILSCGFLGLEIVNWIEDSEYKKIVQTVIEKKPLGTGGAVKFAYRKNENDLIVMNGDTISNIDLLSFYNVLKNKCDIGIGIKSVKIKNYKESGFIDIDKEKNILSFNEKKIVENNSPLGFINTGIYFIKNEAIKLFPNKVPFSIEREVFPNFIHQSSFKIKGYIYDGILVDFGTLDGYKKARSYFSLSD